MQILIVSVLILLIVIFIIYKIRKSYSNKELKIFTFIIVLLCLALIYYNHLEENKMPNAFKENYLEEKKLDIIKLSYNYSALEVLSSNTSRYNFLYIVKKDDKEYVCEAKDVEVQQIEDEYIFKEFKEECRIK